MSYHSRANPSSSGSPTSWYYNSSMKFSVGRQLQQGRSGAENSVLAQRQDRMAPHAGEDSGENCPTRCLCVTTTKEEGTTVYLPGLRAECQWYASRLGVGAALCRNIRFLLATE